jgi:hypothetical protein
MDFNDHSLSDLLLSLEAELAKSLSEVRHAQDDLDKASSRLRFAVALLHNIKNRDIKEKD